MNTIVHAWRRSRVKKLNRSQWEEWLSQPRLAKYVSTAGSKAEELYEWNSRMAAAAFCDVGHFEIALRNAYDERIAVDFPDWGIDPAMALLSIESGTPKLRATQQKSNQGSQTKLIQVRKSLGRNPTHGQVLAALDFGFWTHLTARERTATIWTPYISKAFPSGVTRGEVHDAVDRIRRFRNRLAHSEPMFTSRTGLPDRMQDIYKVFAWIRPEVSEWVRETSQVPGLVSKCPVRGLIIL